MKGIRTWILTVILGLSGCHPEALEIDDIPPPEQKIVVSSLILQDSSVWVWLTRSISALEAGQHSDPRELAKRVAINDAKVTISAAGKAYRLRLLQDGAYQATDIPLVVGERYDLSVESRSLGTVTSTAIMQAPVFFDKVLARSVPYPAENYWLHADYSFQDGDARNHYVVSVQRAAREKLTERVINPRAYTRVLNDEGFNGQEFSESIVITDGFFGQGDSIAFSISNVSEEYYEYVKLRVENELELVQYFAEPMTWPTNVQGGRGFFNMYYTDLRIELAR